MAATVASNVAATVASNVAANVGGRKKVMGKENANDKCCVICTEKFNKSAHASVCCSYCDYTACRVCCETYILSTSVPKCMNTACNKEWSRKFLRENFTSVFLNKKYKSHLEDVLFDRERALLPATQPLVEEVIRKEKITSEIKDLDKKIKELTLRRNVLSQSFWHGSSRPVSEDSKCFHRACPAEACRGYLGKDWTCGLCKNFTCSKCHELIGEDKDAEHTCDPNNVETAELLKKDSKPCPKCHSLIFKISGCNQMWCTQCHTAFSWTTGAIEQNIHNPHFYEWQRLNGGLARAAGDIECGRELNHYVSGDLLKLCREKHTRLRELNSNGEVNSNVDVEGSRVVNRLYRSIRQTIHNNYNNRTRFDVDYVGKNQELRIKYMRNLIDEASFKDAVQKNDKKTRKNGEISRVIQLMNTVISDIVFRFIYHLRTCEPNNYSIDIVTELDNVIKYCNELFSDISFTYKSVFYKFDERCRLYSENPNISLASDKCCQESKKNYL